MKLTFIGDVHGKFWRYLDIVSKVQNSIQVGDFGLGFGDYREAQILEKLNSNKNNHKVLRGNHDNPALFKDTDVWAFKDCGWYKNIFYVAGGDSLDKKIRIEGKDWWRDEELSYAQGNTCLYYYTILKANFPIIVSHESPNIVNLEMYGAEVIKTRTSSLLQSIYDIQAPKLWVFGHHHKSFKKQIDETLFVGLNELETFEVELGGY